MCSRDLKSKRAIKLGATKDTREIFSLSALFLCCLCEIQCAIMARTDPSLDMPLLEFSSDLSKSFLHCSCEQFICLISSRKCCLYIAFHQGNGLYRQCPVKLGDLDSGKFSVEQMMKVWQQQWDLPVMTGVDCTNSRKKTEIQGLWRKCF